MSGSNHDAPVDVGLLVPARGGRKPKRAATAQRFQMNVRTTREMRNRMIDAATASGRSLAQEIELRLELSFALGDINDKLDTIIKRIK